MSTRKPQTVRPAGLQAISDELYRQISAVIRQLSPTPR